MFVGLLKTIFFLAIFYYLFKFIGKVLLPMFIANRVNKMKNQKSYQYSQFRNQKKQEEGKVTIRKGQKANKITSKDLGEYVDYEELKK